MIPYAIRQIMWMLQSAAQLMYLMSTDVLWFAQMVRLYTFGACAWIFFIPHVWWYLTSDRIIRRVSYRSSLATVKRNVLRVLEEEGLTSKWWADRKQVVRGSSMDAERTCRPARHRAHERSAESEPASERLSLSSLQRGTATVHRLLSRSTNGRSAAGPRGPDFAALERITELSINPADGSALKSLPLSQRPRPPGRRASQMGLPPHQHTTPDRRVRPMRSAPATFSKEKDHSSLHCSSSSCDVTTGEEQQHAALHEPGKGKTPTRKGEGAQKRASPTSAAHAAPQRDGSPVPPHPDDETSASNNSEKSALKGGEATRAIKPLSPFEAKGRRSSSRFSDALKSRALADDVEDRMNLHNRAKVDIVLPVPLDSLMQTLDAVKGNTKLRRRKFPVVILVSGGAWIVGSHLWPIMVARIFAARGYVVFCPDYRNFPQTTMEGMTLDVSDAIAWVLNNAERYNGDLDNVTLVGHSAGAHLTMMSLLSQAHLAAYTENGGSASGVPPPSDVAYNVPRYNPRQSIHRYVGLSGTYNLERLLPYFHHRGLSRNVLRSICGGENSLPRYSIGAYFDSRRSGDTGEALPDNVFDFFPARMHFLHGDHDTTSPLSESATLVATLRNAQQRFTLRRLIREEEHNRHKYATARQDAACVLGVPSGPLPPVDIQFIVIPGGGHTDGIVEECITGGRSCCVDFVCDWEPEQPAPEAGGKTVPSAVNKCNERWVRESASEALPDGVLPLAVPPSDRPLLFRLLRQICPF